MTFPISGRIKAMFQTFQTTNQYIYIYMSDIKANKIAQIPIISFDIQQNHPHDTKHIWLCMLLSQIMNNVYINVCNIILYIILYHIMFFFILYYITISVATLFIVIIYIIIDYYCYYCYYCYIIIILQIIPNYNCYIPIGGKSLL